MSETIKVALIYGSTRQGRFCETVAKWVEVGLAARPDFALDVVDPAELGLPERHLRDSHPAVDALRARLGTADAFIIVTPEYNRGYPAALKALIDFVGKEWQAKPVAFVSYGGISGGLRAVEQLRLVFAELHAATVRDGVSFANPWNKFAADGSLHEPEAPAAALATMLDRLHWWAAALRAARVSRPYGKAAA